MPVEFPCPECKQTLRTPDESAGHKAKCPMCSSLVDVPGSSVAVKPEIADPAPSGFDETNPYATPQTQPPPETVGVGGAPLTHTKIEMGTILGRAWNIFKEDMGTLILFGVILFGVAMFTQVLVVPFAILPAIYPDDLRIFVISQIVQQVMGMVAGGIAMAVGIKYIMAFLRGHSSPISVAFKIWPVVLKAIGVQLLMMSIIIGLGLVFVGIPAGVAYAVTQQEDPTAIAAVIGGLCFVPIYAYLIFRFMLAPFFVVDQNVGVIASLGQAGKYSAGNKLTIFGILFAMSIGSVFVIILTCGIGALFVYPFSFLVIALIYVCATGQWPYTRFASSVA